MSTDPGKKLKEMAARIREMREIIGYTVAHMAELTGVTVEEYTDVEAGKVDPTFNFLHQCAIAFGVDINSLLEGHSAHLSGYMVTRAGQGPVTAKEPYMEIRNQAAMFKDRLGTPYWVTYKYDEKLMDQPIATTTHAGHEFDIVLKGSMKIRVGDHVELLNEGDSIYYKSSTPHGMIAATPAGVTFLAMVMAGEDGDSHLGQETIRPKTDKTPLIVSKYVDTLEDESGCLQHIKFRDIERFNFAFDIVDEIAKKYPDKLAMLHVSDHFTERRFTFKEISEMSNQVANYLVSLGIGRGDKVMLVLKRHYQFWFAVLGLHKLGAVAIPATTQLLAKDFAYRFEAANVRAILCTADGDTADAVDAAAAGAPNLAYKILVGGSREGWRDFNDEYTMYSSHFARTQDAPCGNDPMLMFFTSGTSGYPKLAAHNYKYPLGHFITAKYWHCGNPDGLHLTISDTGWAKSMWGKLYGQWLCEAGLFVYDFYRFDAEKILPLFAEHKITTFCAPPTMYRMLIKQDLSRFDLSSIQHASIAGEALNPEVFRQFQNATGLEIMEGFGQSESTLIIGNLIGDSHKIGSMGKPVPLYDVHLLSADGEEVSPGETGEICINIAKGLPCGLSYGYEGSPEITSETWRDGFYHTGDLAWKDEDGFYWYVGRADDVIKSSGYRIGPFEIENVIMELPYVLECGGSAAPDEVRGQVVKASIVLVKGTEGNDALRKEIQNYVKSRTAPYKYPRIVEFRESLPKTTSGKIIRKQL